jgi:spore maturation protein CgeB
MTPPLAVVQGGADPRAVLDALLEAAPGRVLLLGPGQSVKPGALRVLAGLTARPLLWCPAAPHPDLELGPQGRWLMSAKRPPFHIGSPQDASAWGLLGWAETLAESLARCLEALQPDDDWQCVFRAQLAQRDLAPAPADGLWIFQETLPSPKALLEQEAARGRTWKRLSQEGHPGLPHGLGPVQGSQAEVPSLWLDTACALDAVPGAGLRGVEVSGLAASELLPVLAQAVFGRAVALAFARGWHAAALPAPPAVARPISRVAVVYPAYGGSLNLAARSAQALERLGFEVCRVDPSRHAAEVAAAHKDPRGAEAMFRRIEQECLTQLAASQAQAVWILAQAPLSVGALRSLRRRGMLTAYWFCEDYRVRPVWRELATAVDAFFPIQAGPFSGALASLGAAPMPVLPMAAARDACLMPEPETCERRLSFFGAPYANRVALFEALADLPLELYGEGWGQAAGPLLKSMVKDGSRLDEAQGFELFRSSAVNLNLHSSPFHQGIDPRGDYVNPRTYEIAACGAFQLVDRRRDLPAAFTEGTEVAAFSTVAELREQLLRWTADPEGRKRLALASRRRVMEEHTYEHRLEAAMRAMQVALPSPLLGAGIPH